ncbi:MAG: VOC family protein [Phycisphaerae bacterium]
MTSQPTPIADLGLVILATSALEVAVRFYERVFAWPVAVRTPRYVEFSLPRGLRLGIYERTGFAANTGVLPRPVADDELSGAELYVYVSDAGALGRACIANGARPLSPWRRRDWGDEAAYFRGPDGTTLVLARPAAGNEPVGERP